MGMVIVMNALEGFITEKYLHCHMFTLRCVTTIMTARHILEERGERMRRSEPKIPK